jgi:hypothetical protein
MNTRRMYQSVRWLLTTGLLLTMVLTLAGPASVARAASYVVSNLNDSGAGSLRQAILDANATAGTDAITFSVSGTIVLSSTLPTVTDAAGLTIDGVGQSITVGGNDAVRVMVVDNGAALGLHNLTVAGGNAGTSDGGGINNAGTLSVTDSTFSGNSTAGGAAGGGIFNVGTLSVTDSTFSGNSTDGPYYAYGGGIYNAGTLDVTGSTFSSNRSIAGGFGGAWDGGGIYNTGTLSVTDSTFSGNSAGGGTEGDGAGGGIFNLGTLDVTNSTFSGNTAGTAGGGIGNYGTLSVTDSTFSGNSADSYGGGIENVGSLTVTDSTFSGNTTRIAGGGIDNDRTLAVTNSTFSGNSASLGGGIYISGALGGTLTLRNTIVANSTGGNCTNDGSLIDGGGNLSWPDTSCPGLSADPLLGPLQDNGGPTQTLALLPGSTAIDAALLANCPATDQRGVSRPQGPGCDIGAFELEVVYNFSGFFQPVDNLPTFNVMRAGAGVPVRFSLGGDRGLNIFAAGYPVSKQTTCGSGLPQDKIEQTVVAGSSSLSYDSASDTYTYVWKTNTAWAGTCRQFILRLNNGTEHRAKFKFVR